MSAIPSSWPEPPLTGDELDDGGDPPFTVEIAIDRARGRLGYLFTRGLWRLGAPELYVALPPDLPAGRAQDPALALLLATGLGRLARALLVRRDFSVPAHSTQYRGASVTLWLDGAEPPDETLATSLGDEVDTVLRVGCSLWDDPPATATHRLTKA